MNFISDTPKCEIVKMTREVVDALLAMNHHNRRVKRRHVKYLADAANDGSFVLTNQGIGVDVTGTLIDGQHRLMALRDAGYPDGIYLLVVVGLPLTARAAIDIGVNRQMDDIFHFAFDRPEVTKKMVAAVRVWGMIHSGRNLHRAAPGEVLTWYRILEEAMMDCFAVEGAGRLAASVLAAIATQLTIRPEDRRPLKFLHGVISGADLGQDSPMLRLRNWLGSKAAKSGGYTMQQERYQKTTAALRAFLEGRELKALNVGAPEKLDVDKLAETIGSHVSSVQNEELLLT